MGLRSLVVISIIMQSSGLVVHSLRRECKGHRAPRLQYKTARAAYEPSPLDPNIIYSQIAVIAASGGAAAFWWNVLVPARRTELALEKRNKEEGALGGYLEELREVDRTAEDVDGESSIDKRPFERWLLSDWLREKSQQKAAALPFLPKAKFNSGDNPILAATALIMGTGVIFTILGLN